MSPKQESKDFNQVQQGQEGTWTWIVKVLNEKVATLNLNDPTFQALLIGGGTLGGMLFLLFAALIELVLDAVLRPHPFGAREDGIIPSTMPSIYLATLAFILYYWGLWAMIDVATREKEATTTGDPSRKRITTWHEEKASEPSRLKKSTLMLIVVGSSMLALMMLLLVAFAFMEKVLPSPSSFLLLLLFFLVLGMLTAQAWRGFNGKGPLDKESSHLPASTDTTDGVTRMQRELYKKERNFMLKLVGSSILVLCLVYLLSGIIIEVEKTNPRTLHELWTILIPKITTRWLQDDPQHLIRRIIERPTEFLLVMLSILVVGGFVLHGFTTVINWKVRWHVKQWAHGHSHESNDAGADARASNRDMHGITKKSPSRSRTPFSVALIGSFVATPLASLFLIELNAFNVGRQLVSSDLLIQFNAVVVLGFLSSVVTLIIGETWALIRSNTKR